MTVRELVKMLDTEPPEAEVVTFGEDGEVPLIGMGLRDDWKDGEVFRRTLTLEFDTEPLED